jgi:hypothetical protein
MVGGAYPTNIMKSRNQILQLYADAYINLVNDKHPSTNEDIKSSLILNKKEDWEFFCASMKIVGDTCLAIDNFLRYGMDGPTKYQDEGEKYLRLYGLLNATYLQQNAMSKLYDINQFFDVKEIKEKIYKLKIREVRNKIGSHSTEYRISKQEVRSFVPIRVYLSDFSCKYFNNETHEDNDVDLKGCLKEHSALMIDILDKIYEKSIKTFFDGNQEKMGEFSQKLADLRLEKNGSLVIKSNNGNQKIVIKL